MKPDSPTTADSRAYMTSPCMTSQYMTSRCMTSPSGMEPHSSADSFQTPRYSPPKSDSYHNNISHTATSPSSQHRATNYGATSTSPSSQHRATNYSATSPSSQHRATNYSATSPSSQHRAANYSATSPSSQHRAANYIATSPRSGRSATCPSMPCSPVTEPRGTIQRSISHCPTSPSYRPTSPSGKAATSPSKPATFQFAIEDYGTPPSPPPAEKRRSSGETRKSNWISSIISMKSDLDRSIKRARGKLRKQKEGGSGGGAQGQPHHRTIKVDFGSKPHGKKGSSKEAIRESEEASFDQPNNNFSRSLVLTGLQDGTFCSLLPLEHVPRGDLTIRISNHKLIFVVLDSSSPAAGGKYDKRHKVSQPWSCGYLELPIYVDPATLQFEIHPGSPGGDGDVASGETLHIRASLKGLMTRSQSCCTKELLTVPTVGGGYQHEERKSRSCGASPIVHMRRSRSATRQMSVTPEDIRNDLDKFKHIQISARDRAGSQ